MGVDGMDYNDHIEKSCAGCEHYLGGGACRINCEAECREGGGFELYEPKQYIEHERTVD